VDQLRQLILDAIVDDWETTTTMRDCGEMEPDELALTSDDELLPAIESLLDDGLIEAGEPGPRPREMSVIQSPRRDPSSLRRYWYRPTAAGWAEWERADSEG
jgi:hypothetical protein